MSTIVSDSTTVERCSAKVDVKEPKDNIKNGLINGVVHSKKHKKSKNHKNVKVEMLDEVKNSADVFGDGEEKVEQNHVDHQSKNCINTVDEQENNSEKHNGKKFDSNENINDLNPKVVVNNHPENNYVKSSPCSSKSTENNSYDAVKISGELKNLVIHDDINDQTEIEQPCDKKIECVQYESELQMPMIMKIIQKDLSEPYSIYTYRYFIHNWPKLCFLAMCDGQCVGAIVCKLDLHGKVVRRGYIAMLAVDQNYRKLKIGSTLVQMAINEMTLGDADEVVLETEVTNKPALKLYEKLGFVRDKRLFRYYLNGVDALRLKLWLR